MNKDFVLNKWIPALESGEYEQAKGVLRSEVKGGGKVGFCCLGVACDIIAKEQLIEGADWDDDTTNRPLTEEGDAIARPFIAGEGDSSISTLPMAIRMYLGITDIASFNVADANVSDEVAFLRSEFGSARCSGSLVQANDTGSDFMEIARILRHAVEDRVNFTEPVIYDMNIGPFSDSEV